MASFYSSFHFKQWRTLLSSLGLNPECHVAFVVFYSIFLISWFQFVSLLDHVYLSILSSKTPQMSIGNSIFLYTLLLVQEGLGRYTLITAVTTHKGFYLFIFYRGSRLGNYQRMMMPIGFTGNESQGAGLSYYP